MSLFETPLPNGLEYIPNYITEAQQTELILQIDKQPWLNDLKRRVQHYGYKYDYKAHKITPELKIDQIPNWLQILPNFDQVIINEYQQGQGISSHIDCIPCFGNIICSLSLLSPCEMVFTKNADKRSLILEPLSLLILQNEARYEWQHKIPARKSNVKSRRISVTFRTCIL